MLFSIGTDIGYFGAKGFDGKRKAYMPSAIVEREQTDLTDLSMSSANTFTVTVNNKEYLIGDSALQLSGKARRREGRDYHFSDEWYALLLATLTELAIPTGSELILATGLPVQFFNKTIAEELKEILRGQHTIVRNGVSYTYDILHPIVSVQFYGSATAGLLNIPDLAEHLNNPARPVAVADGGGRTWNFGLLHLMRIVADSTYSHDLGSWSAVKTASRRLNRDFERHFSDYEVMEVLRSRKAFYYGDYVDVTEMVEETLEELADPILRVFNDEWEKVLPNVSALFLTGGTPLLLRDYLSHIHPYTYFGSEYDNAVGYQFFADTVRQERYE